MVSDLPERGHYGWRLQPAPDLLVFVRSDICQHLVHRNLGKNLRRHAFVGVDDLLAMLTQFLQ